MYSNEIQVTIEGGGKRLVVLPASLRGTLERLIIRQVGADDGYDLRVLNRKGAVDGQIDVGSSGGGINAVVDEGGKVRLTTDADHELRRGDQILLNWTGTALDRVVGTVTVVVSGTVVDLDLDYVAVASGVWQTAPRTNALLHPDVYLVIDPVAGQTAASYAEFGIKSPYTNRDDQSVTARRNTSMLYLELDVGGSGDKVFEIGWTTVPSSVNV